MFFNDKENMNLPDMEEKILQFWKENKIFEKSLGRGKTRGGRGKARKDYVFYDGPPFATGLPHYGHILASVIKDVIPRYKTMQGFSVPRKWGWDCHGLPIENEIEKELGLKTKKDIEKIGIKNFNEAARKRVLSYTSDWSKIIPRIGRWVDMDNPYKTMDPTYTESVFWIFKNLYDKNLIYEGYKAMHLCPRCGTTLSNFEVAQGYKDIEDISVTAKFELEEKPKTYVLAWTTTPWTLPGNVALAVNKNIEYLKFCSKNYPGLEDACYITSVKNYQVLAAEIEKELFKNPEAKLEITGHLTGSDLTGKKYKPIFPYYAKKYTEQKQKATKKFPRQSALSQRESANWENGWKIYAADFVSAEEGTGIVHIAPAFGEDDYNLSLKYDLPFVQHVSVDGRFKPEVADFAGLSVKPKGNPQETDRLVIDYLKKQNKVFAERKIAHPYPHCWRCETPLLNYAASSWFVKATALKKQLLANNEKINWVPEYIKEGRFGKWLEEVRDWAISRSRFWGAPIPVWRCLKCGKIIVVGSLEDIKKNTKKSGNDYLAMHHGEAESNAFNFISSKYGNDVHLTEKGKRQIKASAKKLKNIDLIFSSDFKRCRETAEITAETVGYPKDKIIYDKRLREVNVGIFEGKTPEEYHNYFSSYEEKFYKTPPEGENLTELKSRVSEFLYEIDKKYKDKKILIVSHEYTTWMLFAGAGGADPKGAIMLYGNKPEFLNPGGIKKLDFTPLPHNDNFELDFHRPYIDAVKFSCKCGDEAERVPDVFDCWFESGSMPYGQAHYPFENKEWFNKNFPAEFIAEGLDQTRGWFYNLLVLSTALFNKPAYKNVIVNGIILAENGQKMSKRLKNYPDPMEIVKKYGADALRIYLLSAPVVRGENLNFSEKDVDEIYKKIIMRLWNSYVFYNLYAPERPRPSALNSRRSTHVLDKWILARLEELKAEVSIWLDKYELDKASRPIGEFIEDLSTWYIRRSRERFKSENKEDKDSAILTTKLVLSEFSKIMAPFAPFISEALYKSLRGKPLKRTQNNAENNISVHLENWPKADKKLINKKLIELMKEVRKISSLALEARQKNNAKVRQPLATLKIKSGGLKEESELLDLIKDEVNVKNIVFDGKIKDEIELDFTITAELKAEGTLREVIRSVQDLRKEAKLLPKDKIYLYLEAPEEIAVAVSGHLSEFQSKTGSEKVDFKRNEKFSAEKETKIGGENIWIGIRKTS
ncbi:class I tRNA ligase family protein [Patescibacteria group bacterium]|nr:class I tRNA ligase family protein [Patescibacteria group bacterium]MCL5733634.1 class I tRNA ligase family protein [Patescibacteria group bacterium]